MNEPSPILRNILNFYRKADKKYILISHGIILAISLYLAMIVWTIPPTFTVTINPITLFVRCFKKDGNGFPILLTLLLFALNIFLFVAIKSRTNNYSQRDERGFTYAKDGTYGTAGKLDTEKMDDMAEIASPENRHGTIVGQMDDSGQNCVMIKEDMSRFNKHISVFGASQSGKSYCFSVPYIMQAQARGESLIITDPKGELFSTTAEMLRKNGYVVKRLDLDKLGYSVKWNPLSTIATGDLETKVSLFAHTVIANTMERNLGSIYATGGEELLKAAVLRVVLGTDYPKEKKNMQSVYNLLLKGVNNMEADFDDTKLKIVGAERSKIPLRSAFSGSENLKGNILQNLTSALNIFQTGAVCDLTSDDELDLLTPAKRKTAYFVCMSDQHRTFDVIGALFFSFEFIELVSFADSQPSKRCPVPVNFLLDEFGNFFVLDGFTSKIATVRSRAIQIAIITQSIGKVMAQYPDTWSDIFSSTATMIGIGFNDSVTEKYFSDRSGEATIQVATKGYSVANSIFSGNQLSRMSAGDGRRMVYTPDELARLDKDKCVVIFQGKNILEINKFGYPQHPAAKEIVETQREYLPCFDAERNFFLASEFRNMLLSYENERLAEYEQWEQEVKLNPSLPKPTVMTYKEIYDAFVAAHPDYLILDGKGHSAEERLQHEYDNAKPECDAEPEPKPEPEPKLEQEPKPKPDAGASGPNADWKKGKLPGNARKDSITNGKLGGPNR